MMPAAQITVEYFFRLIYSRIFGAHASFSFASLEPLLVQIWFWIVVVGYVVSAAGFFVIVYGLVRLFELRKREAEYYGTLILSPEAAGGMNPRWRHIQSLMEGSSPSEWREAIVEADILLDDMLTRQGYTGESVGEKLKNVEPADFKTLQDAWEAHKVRNQIAHQGSTFDLSETFARRTIAHYEAVFREFSAI